MRLSLPRPAPVVAGLLLVVALVAGACKGAPSSPTPPPPPPPAGPTLTGTGFGAGTTVVVSGPGVTVQNVTVTGSTVVTADLVINGYRAALGARAVTVTTPGAAPRCHSRSRQA